LNNPSPIILYRNKLFTLQILTIIYGVITDKQATATMFGTVICVCTIERRCRVGDISYPF
jgi:hypothetical protein